MKINLFLFFLLCPFVFHAQNTDFIELKSIHGIITSKNKPLKDVNIFVENTTRFAISDSIGYYSIKAKIGDIISVNYIGLKPEYILVEDVTEVLNINLIQETNILEINPKKIIKLGEGTIGDNFEEFSFLTIKGSELNKNSVSLISAILEKTNALSMKINDYGEEIVYIKGKELDGPAIWVIDKVAYDIPIPIFIEEVEEIVIINHKINGFTIHVKTNIDYKKLKEINYDNFYFDHNDFYNSDAISYKKFKSKTPEYLGKFKKIKKEEDVLDLYLKTNNEEKYNANYHFNLMTFFKNKKFSNKLILKVLQDYEAFKMHNAEDLKSIAYKYQEINENEKAISIYKEILKQRPLHKQSYRDLGNAFLEIKDYRNVWLTYKYFLAKRLKIKENDIDDIITSEMISAYNLDSTNSTRKIKIINPLKNVSSDVRLVFEWNTTEAEFILEFVNPNSQVYSIENSSKKNYHLIFDQKKNGYTSKEIFIKDLQRGNWLINFTYLGNKQLKPTVLKITTYYNWGKENQKKKIDVFDFSVKNKKLQLLKLNRRYL